MTAGAIDLGALVDGSVGILEQLCEDCVAFLGTKLASTNDTAKSGTILSLRPEPRQLIPACR
jgi:hypothetical protein